MGSPEWEGKTDAPIIQGDWSKMKGEELISGWQVEEEEGMALTAMDGWMGRQRSVGASIFISPLA